MQWFINIEYWLYERFGYDFIIHFEDTVQFLSGIFIGMIIMVFMSGRVVFKVHPVKNLGKNKIKLIRFVKENGEKTYVADPQSLGESMETLLLVTFQPAFTYKQYSFRDERRTKIFIVTMSVVGAILLILGFFSIVTIFTPPQ